MVSIQLLIAAALVVAVVATPAPHSKYPSKHHVKNSRQPTLKQGLGPALNIVFNLGKGIKSVVNGVEKVGLASLGLLGRGVIEVKGNAGAILKTLGSGVKVQSYDDIQYIFSGCGASAGALINIWVPGLGSLLSSMILASTRICTCVLGDIKPQKHVLGGLLRGLQKKPILQAKVCSDKSYGNEWGWEEYGADYEDVDSVISFYELKGAADLVSELLSVHAKVKISDLDGFVHAIAQDIYEIALLFKRPATEWTRVDINIVYLKLAYILENIGNLYHRKLGRYIFEDILQTGSYNDYGKAYGLDLVNYRHKVKRTVVVHTTRQTQWYFGLGTITDNEFNLARDGNDDNDNNNSNILDITGLERDSGRVSGDDLTKSKSKKIVSTIGQVTSNLDSHNNLNGISDKNQDISINNKKSVLKNEDAITTSEIVTSIKDQISSDDKPKPNVHGSRKGKEKKPLKKTNPGILINDLSDENININTWKKVDSTIVDDSATDAKGTEIKTKKGQTKIKPEDDEFKTENERNSKKYNKSKKTKSDKSRSEHEVTYESNSSSEKFEKIISENYDNQAIKDKLKAKKTKKHTTKPVVQKNIDDIDGTDLNGGDKTIPKDNETEKSKNSAQEDYKTTLINGFSKDSDKKDNAGKPQKPKNVIPKPGEEKSSKPADTDEEISINKATGPKNKKDDGNNQHNDEQDSNTPLNDGQQEPNDVEDNDSNPENDEDEQYEEKKSGEPADTDEDIIANKATGLEYRNDDGNNQYDDETDSNEPLNDNQPKSKKRKDKVPEQENDTSVNQNQNQIKPEDDKFKTENERYSKKYNKSKKTKSDKSRSEHEVTYESNSSSEKFEKIISENYDNQAIKDKLKAKKTKKHITKPVVQKNIDDIDGTDLNGGDKTIPKDNETEKSKNSAQEDYKTTSIDGFSKDSDKKDNAGKPQKPKNVIPKPGEEKSSKPADTDEEISINKATGPKNKKDDGNNQHDDEQDSNTPLNDGQQEPNDVEDNDSNPENDEDEQYEEKKSGEPADTDEDIIANKATGLEYRNDDGNNQYDDETDSNEPLNDNQPKSKKRKDKVPEQENDTSVNQNQNQIKPEDDEFKTENERYSKKYNKSKKTKSDKSRSEHEVTYESNSSSEKFEKIISENYDNQAIKDKLKAKKTKKHTTKPVVQKNIDDIDGTDLNGVDKTIPKDNETEKSKNSAQEDYKTTSIDGFSKDSDKKDNPGKPQKHKNVIPKPGEEKSSKPADTDEEISINKATGPKNKKDDGNNQHNDEQDSNTPLNDGQQEPNDVEDNDSNPENDEDEQYEDDWNTVNDEPQEQTNGKYKIDQEKPASPEEKSEGKPKKIDDKWDTNTRESIYSKKAQETEYNTYSFEEGITSETTNKISSTSLSTDKTSKETTASKSKIENKSHTKKPVNIQQTNEKKSKPKYSRPDNAEDSADESVYEKVGKTEKNKRKHTGNNNKDQIIKNKALLYKNDEAESSLYTHELGNYETIINKNGDEVKKDNKVKDGKRSKSKNKNKNLKKESSNSNDSQKEKDKNRNASENAANESFDESGDILSKKGNTISKDDRAESSPYTHELGNYETIINKNGDEVKKDNKVKDGKRSKSKNKNKNLKKESSNSNDSQKEKDKNRNASENAANESFDESGDILSKKGNTISKDDRAESSPYTHELGNYETIINKDGDVIKKDNKVKDGKKSKSKNKNKNLKNESSNSNESRKEKDKNRNASENAANESFDESGDILSKSGLKKGDKKTKDVNSKKTKDGKTKKQERKENDSNNASEDNDTSYEESEDFYSSINKKTNQKKSYRGKYSKTYKSFNHESDSETNDSRKESEFSSLESGSVKSEETQFTKDKPYEIVKGKYKRSKFPVNSDLQPKKKKISRKTQKKLSEERCG